MTVATSGLGASVALAMEASYGTYKAANRFYEFASEGLNLSRAYVLSKQLRGGRQYQSSSRRTATTRSASGPISMEIPNQQFGTILNLMHGETVTPSKEGATTMYKQVHNIGTTDPYLKSASVQVGKPNTGGTVEPFSYPGSICTSLELACQSGALAMANLTLDNRNEVVTEAFTTLVYPTGLESFNFTKAKVKVNGAELTQARGFTFSINGPRDTGRYYLGATEKAVPLSNEYSSATCSLTVDYSDNTLYNIFAKAEIVSLEILIQGIAKEAITQELKLVCAACGLDGDSPNVGGPGILGQTVPIVVLDNGTNPPVVATYVASDVAI